MQEIYLKEGRFPKRPVSPAWNLRIVSRAGRRGLRAQLTWRARISFIVWMKGVVRLVAFVLCTTAFARPAEEAKILTKVDPLPTALSSDFEFRKAKLYSLGAPASEAATEAKKKLGGTSTRATAAVAEASLNFESRYRLFGAVTSLDQRERYGNYFDFFWRAKRDADVTVRLEYQQERLRSFVQARELHYPHARGRHKSQFAIIGDDFLDDGRVLAWRCLLVEKGHIVAEKRSYLWR